MSIICPQAMWVKQCCVTHVTSCSNTNIQHKTFSYILKCCRTFYFLILNFSAIFVIKYWPFFLFYRSALLLTTLFRLTVQIFEMFLKMWRKKRIHQHLILGSGHILSVLCVMKGSIPPMPNVRYTNFNCFMLFRDYIFLRTNV